MNANETKLQPFIEGTKQYLVPLYQRPYTWDDTNWKRLWSDLKDLYQSTDTRPHFFGSIVTMPSTSVPEGITKFLLIDGQQRLTTVAILLAIIRDLAQSSIANELHILAAEIDQTLLVNKFKSHHDYYKLQPTKTDREAFHNLINKTGNLSPDSSITKAYKFFERAIKRDLIDIEKLSIILIKRLSIVSIVLDGEDNPNVVFEGLNWKGTPLTQADLLRNYFVMMIHVDKQDVIYEELWEPIEISLRDVLTEFIRHYLMKDGKDVKKNEVYLSLKEDINPTNAIERLRDLNKFAKYYERLIYPDRETNSVISNAVIRFQRLDISFCYPFLLNCYEEFQRGRIRDVDFVSALKIVENFILRRFVCNVPTYGLHKVFAALFNQIDKSNLIDSLEMQLQAHDYPTNREFLESLKIFKLYGAGERAQKTKLILESIEESYKHKEPVNYSALSVEHVMPQTLTDDWRKELGGVEDAEVVYDLYLHTIGNLTLTGYNSELSNAAYKIKKEKLLQSHIELNSYFAKIDQWGKNEILQRTAILSEQALAIWPYFGKKELEGKFKSSVAGTKPIKLSLLGQEFPVQTWRDVLEKTISVIAELDPEKFEALLLQHPRFVGRNKSAFKTARELNSGVFIEVHLSADSIRDFCLQTVEFVGLTRMEWHVETSE
ncbi:MAG: DUF262 domain-containing protein [Gallionella sp.]|nr:DUF262 domain-containing protein [Gallionella sp.]